MTDKYDDTCFAYAAIQFLHKSLTRKIGETFPDDLLDALKNNLYPPDKSSAFHRDAYNLALAIEAVVDYRRQDIYELADKITPITDQHGIEESDLDKRQSAEYRAKVNEAWREIDSRRE